MKPLSDLRMGEKAVIKVLGSDALGKRLIEMGCIPGEIIRLSKIAPLGCPLAITVLGYELSLRKEEARTILVEPVLN